MIHKGENEGGIKTKVIILQISPFNIASGKKYSLLINSYPKNIYKIKTKPVRATM
jgi:hypothetical protein